MPHYLLYYVGDDDPPPGDLDRIKSSPAVSVVASRSDVLIIDADQERLEHLAASLPGWEYSTGSKVHLPVEDGRPRATTHHQS
ncbi:hypothetical protein SAMN05428943_1093 [Streptomyces sp. 2314.4]|nr:hypothetical protein SAMN05428943_1093 [Streptomyces sp. 2314.4]